MPAKAEPIYLETGKRRVFACSVNWPGWARSGRDEEAALQSLAACASRYAPVAARAGLQFPSEAAPSFDVIERLAGNATTDFGAPGAIPEIDAEPLQPEKPAHLASLIAAAWQTLDAVVAAAPAELRKGPRGGGRNRDKIVAHVLGAEVEYARKLGLRLKQPAFDDHRAIASFREAILSELVPGSTNRGIGESNNPPWPLPYVARRIAWHTLDHAWEIEDRG